MINVNYNNGVVVVNNGTSSLSLTPNEISNTLAAKEIFANPATYIPGYDREDDELAYETTLPLVIRRQKYLGDILGVSLKKYAAILRGYANEYYIRPIENYVKRWALHFGFTRRSIGDQYQTSLGANVDRKAVTLIRQREDIVCQYYLSGNETLAGYGLLFNADIHELQQMFGLDWRLICSQSKSRNDIIVKSLMWENYSNDKKVMVATRMAKLPTTILHECLKYNWAWIEDEDIRWDFVNYIISKEKHLKDVEVHDIPRLMSKYRTVLDIGPKLGKDTRCHQIWSGETVENMYDECMETLHALHESEEPLTWLNQVADPSIDGFNVSVVRAPAEMKRILRGHDMFASHKTEQAIKQNFVLVQVEDQSLDGVALLGVYKSVKSSFDVFDIEEYEHVRQAALKADDMVRGALGWPLTETNTNRTTDTEELPF